MANIEKLRECANTGASAYATFKATKVEGRRQKQLAKAL